MTSSKNEKSILIGKFSFLLIVMSLIFTCSLMFSACNGNESEGNGGEGGNTSSIATDYNYQQIGSNIDQMAGQDGLYVNLHITRADVDGTESANEYNIILGAKNQIYYLKSENTEAYVDFSNQTACDIYSKNDETWSKFTVNYSAQFTKETIMNTYGGMVYNYLGFYKNVIDILDGMREVKTQATIAGRNCDKYSYSVSATTVNTSASVACDIYIDKATGICLKFMSNASVQNASSSVSFECTEFSTTYNPVLPVVQQQ